VDILSTREAAGMMQARPAFRPTAIPASPQPTEYAPLPLINGTTAAGPGIATSPGAGDGYAVLPMRSGGTLSPVANGAALPPDPNYADVNLLHRRPSRPSGNLPSVGSPAIAPRGAAPPANYVGLSMVEAAAPATPPVSAYANLDSAMRSPPRNGPITRGPPRMNAVPPALLRSPSMEQRAIMEQRAMSARQGGSVPIVPDNSTAYSTMPSNPGDRPNHALAASNVTSYGQLKDDDDNANTSVSPSSVSPVAGGVLCEQCGKQQGTQLLSGVNDARPRRLCPGCVVDFMQQQVSSNSPSASPPVASSPGSARNSPIHVVNMRSSAGAPRLSAGAPPAAAATQSAICEHCVAAPATSKMIFDDGRPSLRTCQACNNLLLDNPNAPRPSVRPGSMAAATTAAPAPAPVAAAPPPSLAALSGVCEHCLVEPIVAKVLFEDGRPVKRTCKACTNLLTDDPDAPPPNAPAAAAPVPRGPALTSVPLPTQTDANGVPLTSLAANATSSATTKAQPIDLMLRPLGPRAAEHPTPACYMDLDDDLSRYDWFHGKLSKVGADALLANEAVGTFLVRNRTGGAGGEFVLVWKESGKDKPTHILVRPNPAPTPSQRVMVQAVDNSFHYYSTILSVVRTYTRRHMRSFFKATTVGSHDADLMKLRVGRGDAGY
jgi:hypothetical protein